jgi:elongation factor Ts
VVPGNDDSTRAIQLYCQRVADACAEGASIFNDRIQSQVSEQERTAPAGEVSEKSAPAASWSRSSSSRAAGAARTARRRASASARERRRTRERPRRRAPAPRRASSRGRGGDLSEGREDPARADRRGDDGLQARARGRRGDLEKATDLLRERGLAKAGKREGRATSEGAIAIALAGRAGAMIELGCETDFVARTDAFIALGDARARGRRRTRRSRRSTRCSARRSTARKVSDRIVAAIAVLGENVVVKRVSRLAVDRGVVGGYVHAGGKLGVLVALSAPDAAPALSGLAKDIAMHIAAADPSPVAVSRDGIPAALLASEREIFRKQALASGKPEKILDKIVDGKVDKFVSEVALVEQPFVKDPTRRSATC